MNIDMVKVLIQSFMPTIKRLVKSVEIKTFEAVVIGQDGKEKVFRKEDLEAIIQENGFGAFLKKGEHNAENNGGSVA